MPPRVEIEGIRTCHSPRQDGLVQGQVGEEADLVKSEAEVRARLEVKIWCSHCCVFHEAEKDRNYENVYSDKCNQIVSIVIKKRGGGGGG